MLATVGGEDQITVVPHLDADLVTARPQAVPRLQRQHQHPELAVETRRPRLLRRLHAGPPRRRPRRRRRPRAVAARRAAHRRAPRDHRARRVGGLRPGLGRSRARWASTATASRPSPGPGPGPRRTVTGRTWGGCIEVLQWILTAGRFPADPAVVDGGVLLLETSEELIAGREFGWILRGARRARDPRGRGRGASSPARRPPTSRAVPSPPSAGPRAGRAARRRDRDRRRATTPTRWSWSACPSATPGRSGSCRTAGR